MNVDKKLTDSEIVKALECCARPLPHCYCGECPAGANGGCAIKTEDIIDLINRLEARIGVYETCDARKDEAIKSLESRLKKVQMQLDDMCIMYHVIKSEAYKEFAERLDKEFSGVGTCNYGYVHHKTRKVLKEMVGDGGETVL